MSFEVNIVNNEIIAKKIKNNANWLLFAFLLAKTARYLNSPNSSKNTEMIVIEKNKISILIGLTALSEVNWVQTSFIGANDVAKRMIAPIKDIIQ